MWRNWNPPPLLLTMSTAASLENSVTSPQKVRVLPHTPAIPLLDIYPRKLKTDFQTKTCTWMFIAALFTIAKNGNHPNVHRYTDKYMVCNI